MIILKVLFFTFVAIVVEPCQVEQAEAFFPSFETLTMDHVGVSFEVMQIGIRFGLKVNPQKDHFLSANNRNNFNSSSSTNSNGSIIRNTNNNGSMNSCYNGDNTSNGSISNNLNNTSNGSKVAATTALAAFRTTTAAKTATTSATTAAAPFEKPTHIKFNFQIRRWARDNPSCQNFIAQP